MNLRNVSGILIGIIALLSLYACDKDFIDLESDVIGDSHFDFTRYDGQLTVVAYNQGTGIVQSNNLPNISTDISVNSLGYYNNPAFGATTAHFVSQVELAAISPEFSTNIVMDSVYMEIPYFSTRTNIVDGDSTYELDSITTSQNGRMRLSIFESGYFIPDLDPSPESNLEERIRLYSDQKQTFESYKKGSLEDGTSVFNGPRLNNSTNTQENDQFFFNPAEVILTKLDADGDEIVTRKTPRLRVSLNKNFFKKKVIDAPESVLENNTAFKNHLRGLFFQVEQQTGNCLGNLNFTTGTITLYYTEDQISTVNGAATTTRVQKELVLNLTGNRANLFEQTYTPTYAAALNPANINTSVGDERLYVKGGEGSVAVIDLFGRTNANGGNSAELEALRNEAEANNWLINEANLTFYIDQDAMGESVEPQRIFLYDLTNQRVIGDYSAQDPGPSGFPKFNKPTFGGFLEKINGNGLRYKFRITRHISNLLKNRESTNVRLGLVVTESINDTRFARLKPGQPNNQVFSQVPVASVLNPFGTILFGSSPLVDASKRLKLEIYYTKPKE
ncbi:DUF4270 domain-containing protein [Flavobacterium aurantiibacter]|uniref:DUF4270 domain-containing protein n=1 Tax=Flavobacterium aurantiibacter TaxID=2023067 RepID=A0A255ZRZ6_9FLAO|nr:DUF4270 domain-containing protein [Flavobacterium aurantiibacter]OYQ43645.1 hypothetical protein CHX27_09220 [Flavobacterium aurantiibacter]